MGAFYGALSALSIGVSDFFGRRVVAAATPITAAAIMQIFAAALSVVGLAVVDSAYDHGDVAIGAASGLGMAGGLACYYRGLERSSSAVVAPLVATLSALIPYTYTLIRGEPAKALGVVGAVAALVGLLLITSGGTARNVRTGLTWGVLAGCNYGFGLTVVIEASAASGAWPAVSQRAVAFVVLVVVAAGVGVPVAPPAGVRGLAVVGGVLGGLVSIFYLLGVQADARPAVVTAAMFPVPSVVIGYLFYRDEVTPSQIAGIAVVLAGVSLVVTT